MSGARVSDEEYERLALDMLSAGTGEIVDVTLEMSAIIASAPEGTDVARLLTRALSLAADRVAQRS